MRRLVVKCMSGKQKSCKHYAVYILVYTYRCLIQYLPRVQQQILSNKSSFLHYSDFIGMVLCSFTACERPAVLSNGTINDIAMLQIEVQ